MTPEKAKAPTATHCQGFQGETRTEKNGISMNATAQTPHEATPGASSLSMPTCQQVIALALARAEHRLRWLIDIRNHDDRWNDDDIDVDNATELCLRQVLAMKEQGFSGYVGFDTEWFVAASAINMAAKLFSRHDCVYYRSLLNTRDMFAQMIESVEFSDKAA